jgi:superfamily II DNA or RNA helicase
MTAVLRPYQTDITAEFERHVKRGDRRILLVAPTSSGKTIIASSDHREHHSSRVGGRPPARDREPDLG